MKIGNIEVYGIIYKITNTINGKCYIGQTMQGFTKRYKAKGRGIERVYRYNKRLRDNKKRYSKYLLNSIEKYGFDCWEIIEVFDVAFSKTELNIKERHYISLFNSSNEKYGYNLTNGGEDFIDYNPWLHKTEEEKEEWCNNLSKSRIENGCAKGKNNPMYGRTWWDENTPQEKIDEWKRKISEANKGKTYPSPLVNKTDEEISEWKRKISEANKGLSSAKAKTYRIIDLDGNETTLCGKELYNDHSKGLLNVEKRIFDKYIKPYGNIDIDRINITPRSKITIEKLKPFNGWIVEEIT